MIGLETLLPQELGEAERIALAYAPRALRADYRGLAVLDAQLGRIALTACEPALAQLKLAWWRDACDNLAAPRGQPVVQLLTEAWLGRGEVLAALVDAWEELAVREQGFLAAVEAVAVSRANAFATAADAAADSACRAAARRWTLVTLTQHAPDAEQRVAMLTAAGEIETVRLTRAMRPLAVLDGLARRALRRGGGALLGDRLSPLVAIRLGIFGR